MDYDSFRTVIARHAASVLVLIFLIPFAAFQGSALAAEPTVSVPRGKAQPVILTFGYGGLVDTYVTALYVGDSLYLPVHTLLTDLKIFNKLDMRQKKIEGFYVNESDRYELNFANLTATIGGRTIAVDSTKIISGPVDFYLLPSVFTKVFGMDFSVDMNKLVLILKTRVKLPIIANYERRLKLQYQTQPLGIFRPQAPLLYPERRAMLNGGVLDYAISAFRGASGTSYSYNLNAGAQLLGGDIEGAINGGYSGGMSTIYSKQVHWRYTIDSTRAITSVSLGNLFSNGLVQYDFRGIQITNTPVQIRRLFGNYAFSEKVQPGWDTELFLNGARVGYQRADALGNVHYNIPLIYGTSFIQMKTYGPSGQYQEVDKRLQIPFTLVPDKEFDYTLSAGPLANSDSSIVQFNAAYGISDWITDRVGIDYLQSKVDKRPVPYNALAFRLGSPYIISLQAAPAYGYEVSLNAIYPSQASYGFTYDKFEDNALYNPSFKREQLFATAYLPVSIGGNTLNFSFSGTGQTFKDGSENVTYSFGSNASVSRLNLSANYTGSYQRSASSNLTIGRTLSASFLYSFFFGSGPLSFLNGTLSGISGDYDIADRALTSMRLDLSQYFGGYVSVELYAQRDFLNRSNSFNLQVTCDLPFVQTSSSASYQGNQSSFSQYVSGSVGYDSHYDKFLFNGLHWVGQSAVSMRMYLDVNQDGNVDKGDELIKDGSITLRQAASSDLFTSGIIRAWNLMPYSQYSADIQSGSLRNPLWMPDRESFSFMTDPNTYKAIDIPYYSAGVIQGRAVQIDKGKETAVPGLEVIVEAKHGLFRKTISAFNDGSLYYVGIPPGEYRIYVDPSQLDALDDQSEPASRDFTVKFKRAGDFIKGLTFQLSRRVEVVQTAPPPIVEPKKYVVQLGAFTTAKRAEEFAHATRPKIDRRISVIYNKGSHLYSVQLDTMSESRKAYTLVQDLIYNKGIRDAFVMVIPAPRVEYTFAVRIGMFRSLSSAIAFANDARSLLGVGARVDFNSPLRIFEVTAGSFGTRKAAKALLENINSNHVYRNASIVVTGHYPLKRYAVLLNTFESYNSAENYARGIFNNHKVDALIDFDPATVEFRVFTMPMQHYDEAERELESIRPLKLFNLPTVILVR